jgi:hypothetical protein
MHALLLSVLYKLDILLQLEEAEQQNPIDQGVHRNGSNIDLQIHNNQFKLTTSTTAKPNMIDNINLESLDSIKIDSDVLQD